MPAAVEMQRSRTVLCMTIPSFSSLRVIALNRLDANMRLDFVQFTRITSMRSIAVMTSKFTGFKFDILLDTRLTNSAYAYLVLRR